MSHEELESKIGAGRTVLVTGASSGIGLATAIELAARGFHVVATVRGEGKAQGLRQSAADADVAVEVRFLDVADRDGCEELIESLPSLYAIVNNAGFNAVTAIEDATDEDAAYALEVMAIAPMRLARLGLPLLKASGGRIVQISSVAGRASIPLAGWYGAAKHALCSASDSLRMEVAGSGVAVITVAPGIVRTPIWAETDHASSSYAASYDRLWALNALAGRRLGLEADDVARAVARVLSADRPPRSVLLGADAHVIVALDSWLPARLSERLLRLAYKL